MKIALITDSVAYLSKEEQEKMNVYILPLSVEYEGNVYVEGEDLTGETFFDLIRGGATLPKSSQPTLGRTMELFETLSKEYDAAIAVHLSSDISGTFQTTFSQKDSFDGFTVYPVDSRRAVGSQVMLLRLAHKLIQEGKTPEEIIPALQAHIQTHNVYFLVDDLTNLQKGGRLSATSAFVGKMLSIKPLLTIDGKIEAIEKIRTFKKGVSRIVELVEAHAATLNNVPMSMFVYHGNALNVAEDLTQQLKAKFPDSEFQITSFGPVIGTHLGEGSVGVLFGEKV
ncbi:DegV family protein [Carnobacteriaceae bacterium zg-ZUI252]|nr:DegV family protein [Carnobacteriaceae bacterium zg-ZUI252]MBS4770427.1 DegV family protein [Carnobacteriaceae bacterium zg-ZUI240]QTU83549.1 DegV family protein [Carnobacteriaceae bacterium zg-C25]